MARKIFKNKTEAQCALCEHGSPTPNGEAVVCRKAGGVMQPFSKCRKFKYDPLKREPQVLPFAVCFSQEDFEL